MVVPAWTWLGCGWRRLMAARNRECAAVAVASPTVGPRVRRRPGARGPAVRRVFGDAHVKYHEPGQPPLREPHPEQACRQGRLAEPQTFFAVDAFPALGRYLAFPCIARVSGC